MQINGEAAGLFILETGSRLVAATSEVALLRQANAEAQAKIKELQGKLDALTPKDAQPEEGAP